ncbi:MAG: hypothetical protein HZC40_12940 [Chloroflexi bacterium]|nr:hypothetical protein [Chloroflexota bacterium]
MQKIFARFLVLIFAAACAAPRAAPKPTAAPAAAPTSARATPAPSARTATAPPGSPQPTRAGITVKDVTQKKNPDGTTNTSANVATENLGIGQIELAAPDTMLFDETRSIRLRLSPAQQLVALPTISAPAKTPDLPNFTYRFGGNVQLYPVMFAELRALNFTMDQKGALRRNLEANKPVEWVWVIKPLSAGRQELTLELAIPTVANGIASEMTTNVLQNLPIVIQVAAPPTPQVIATQPAPSLADRLWDSLIGEFGALIVAAVGAVGTFIGWLIKSRAKK